MNSFQATATVIAALEVLKIPYMLVGAYSSNAYGIGRSTNDADIVVQFGGDDLPLLMKHLTDDFTLDRQLQFETLTGSTRSVITFVPTNFQIELFRLNLNDEHHKVRFLRRRRLRLSTFDRDVWLPTAEDVIIQKLRWQRGKDIDDVIGILAVNGTSLDWTYLNQWTAKHNTSELLKQLIDSIPDQHGPLPPRI
jgi:hypothetical protein